MAKKATSVYVSIVKKETHKTEINKMFFNSKEANEWIATQEEKYQKPEFYFVKETY